MGKVSKDNRDRIRDAVVQHERDCDQRRADTIFDLAIRLGLQEETVERIWEDSI